MAFSFKNPPSLQRRLEDCGGVGPGFDLLRIGLAVAIFYGHALWVAGGNGGAAPVGDMAGWTGWKRPLHVALVPMFFALSGFLVAGSAERLRDVRTFMAFRLLRLLPALAVEVVLSAIVLGAVFSSLDLAAYARDPLTWRYLGNMAGWISFHLPGVFRHNPATDIVNVNLWTLPAEFYCYAVLAALMVSGLLFRRAVLSGLFVAVTVVLAALNLLGDFSVTPTTLSVTAITYYFFVGVMAFLWRGRIPFSLPLFLVCGAVSYAALYGHHTVFIAPVFVTYCTVYLGLTRLPRIKLIASGDYSYGVYLYGFPISQAMVAALPWLHGRGWANVILSLIVTAAFAAFSWHVIEKPMLRWKKKLPARFFPLQAKVKETPTEVVSVAP